MLSTSDYRNDNDAIAKFITEMITVVRDGDEMDPVTKAGLKRAFKTWKDENDQRSLAPADMEKRIIEQFGRCPENGWANFKLKN
jgi:phage/plasmid-associated DNA primase